jgi:hypothetical protein
MSVYRQIFEAVEDAVFQKQVKNAEEAAKWVEWDTGLKNINPREVEKIIHKVATQYKTS